MQERPAGWPIEGAVETIPEVFVKLPGSTWPPAMGGAPAGTGACGAWSITRDLTGGFLPGQVRGASGFSVAVATAQIPQPASPLSPWAAAGSQLTPGGQATLYASHDGADGSTALQLGKFRVDPISGASTDPALNLDLIEDSGRLKRPVAIRWAYTSTDAERYSMDASWALDQIARAGGFYATPKPGSSTVLSMPLVGGPACDRGTTEGALVDMYREVEHTVGLSGVSSVEARQSGTGVNGVFYLTCQVAGSGGVIRMGDTLIEVTPASVVVREGSTTRGTVAIGSAGLVRVQLRIVRVSGGFTVQARTSESSWPAATTVSISGASPWASDDITVSSLSSTGFIRAVRLDNTADSAVWGQPSAVIDLSGSPIRGIFDMEKQPGWDLAQNIATATLGGLWISENGVFTYRNRHTLRGIDGPVETIEALDQLETLQWRVDPADIADRVTVTYTPAEVRRANDSITLWEATNIIVVRQYSTQTIYADIEGTADRISDFRPVWDETVTATRFSRYAASTSREAGGAQPADGALTFRTEMAGPSRVKIMITNHTGGPLWLVDGNGEPTLTLRTSVHVAPGEPVTVEQGLSESNSIAPLSIDCGAAVQDHATAVELCAWLEGQTRVALPTIGDVRVKPDLRRQIGDVVRITDGITSLDSKAIITGITLDGSAEGYTQTVKLALMATTFLDVDEWLASTPINTFTGFDDWLTSQNITTFAQLDGWLDTLGRTA